MSLQKIKATSIVEITIALVIISVCMGIASRFFIGIDQQLKSPIQLKDESSYQNWMIENYELDSIQSDRNLEMEHNELVKTINKTSDFYQVDYSLENQSSALKYQSFHPTTYREN